MNDIHIGANSSQIEQNIYLPLKRANRHGCIAAATGSQVGRQVTNILIRGLLDGLKR
jgi:hypothetical protein